MQVEVTRLESDTWAESEVNKVEEFVNFINSELASELAWPCRELVGWYMEDRRDVAETDKRCGNFIVISNRVYEKCKLVNRIKGACRSFSVNTSRSNPRFKCTIWFHPNWSIL